MQINCFIAWADRPIHVMKGLLHFITQLRNYNHPDWSKTYCFLHWYKSHSYFIKSIDPTFYLLNSAISHLGYWGVYCFHNLSKLTILNLSFIPWFRKIQQVKKFVLVCWDIWMIVRKYQSFIGFGNYTWTL